VGGPPQRTGALSRSPAFARLVVARSASLLGDGIGALALVVHVQREEGTGTAVGLLLLVGALPRLLSPLTGALADRVDRRRLLVAAEVAQAVAVGAAAVWLPPLPVLLALLAAKALAATVAEPASRSAVPALVADADLPGANALLGGVREAGEALGPLLGGLLVAGAGVRAGLAVDALTCLISVPLLARVPPLPTAPAPATGGAEGPADARPGLVAAAVEGLRTTAGLPFARAAAVGFLLLGLTAADDVALPFLADDLGAGPVGIGALYAAVGVGLLAGYAVLVGRGGGRLAPARGFVLGAAVAALANLLTGVAPALAAAVGAQVARGVGIAVLDTHVQTLVQRRVPPAVMGRVFANVYGAADVAAIVALLAGGPLLDATSPRVVLVGVGVLGLGGAVVTARLLRPGRAGPRRTGGGAGG
jgi:MFS family permease